MAKLLKKWVEWSDSHPKSMRRISLFFLVLYSLGIVNMVYERRFDAVFLLTFWFWVWSLFDWITSMITFK